MASENKTTGATVGGTETVIQNVLKGLQNAIPPTVKLNLGGTLMVVTAIESQLTGYLPEFTAVAAAQAAYKQSVTDRNASLPAIKTFLKQLKTALVAQLGEGNPVLAQFGYSVTQKKQLTVTEKAAADAKRQATLAERGIVGKRKRAQVQAGAQQVTIGPLGVTVTPVTAPSGNASGTGGTGNTSGGA